MLIAEIGQSGRGSVMIPDLHRSKGIRQVGDCLSLGQSP